MNKELSITYKELQKFYNEIGYKFNDFIDIRAYYIDDGFECNIHLEESAITAEKNIAEIYSFCGKTAEEFTQNINKQDYSLLFIDGLSCTDNGFALSDIDNRYDMYIKQDLSKKWEEFLKREKYQLYRLLKTTEINKRKEMLQKKIEDAQAEIANAKKQLNDLEKIENMLNAETMTK